MTVPLDFRLIGRWRIVEADLSDRAHLDLLEPAMMTIGAHGRGEIAFGTMQGGLELEYARSTVFFTWAGFEEIDQVSGSGSAELQDDGSLEIAFAYHLGDEPILKAVRTPSSTNFDFDPCAHGSMSATGIAQRESLVRLYPLGNGWRPPPKRRAGSWTPKHGAARLANSEGKLRRSRDVFARQYRLRVWQ